MNYATGYGISATELYTSFPPHLIKTHKSKLPCDNKKRLGGRIFIYFMYLVIMDIIHNNVTFKLPTTTETYLEMNSLSREEFIRAKQNGAYEDVDAVDADFKANHIQLRFQFPSGKKYCKPIYVCKKLKDIITNYTNKGKMYG